MNRIGSTKIGHGLVGGRRWAWALLSRLALRARSSRCALAARAARSRCALAGRARSQLIFCTAKIYEFIHDNCKKYMNSYIIWIHICMNSYFSRAKNIWIHTRGTPNYIRRSDSKPLKSDLQKSDITWQLEWNLVNLLESQGLYLRTWFTKYFNI